MRFGCFFKKWIFSFVACAFFCISFVNCAFPERHGYNRKIGGYGSENSPSVTAETSSDFSQNAPKKQEEISYQKREQAASNEANSAKPTKVAKAAKTQNVKTVTPKKAENKKGLEPYAKQWLGAKYVYGAATKTQTDCSGFVTQVFTGYFNLQLPRTAANMYKDSRGKTVSKSNLKEGDLVFFGGLFSIDHVGIYLSNDRFIHASTSKGVTISKLSEKYWKKKYQGARRFI